MLFVFIFILITMLMYAVGYYSVQTIREEKIQEIELMRFANFVRFSILIMAVTTTKMRFVVIHAVNALKMLSSLTCGTNHIILSNNRRI